MSINHSTRHSLMPTGAIGGTGVWWLAGDINPVNCIAAYQPKGAADYQASKVNLANPGTYNATEGNAPDWNVNTGWQSTGGKRLFTGISAPYNQTWSIICRFSGHSGAGNQALMGAYYNGAEYPGIMVSRIWTGGIMFMNGGLANLKQPAITSGVLCVAGSTGYVNGLPLVKISTVAIQNPYQISLMAATTYSNTGVYGYSVGYFQAFAIYNTVLSDDQVFALTNAMNAL